VNFEIVQKATKKTDIEMSVFKKLAPRILDVGGAVSA
jgi:hypothetical protein